MHPTCIRPPTRVAPALHLVAVLFCAASCLAASAAEAQAASAPTRDQRALKVLAEARDLVAAGRADESIPFYGHALDLAEAELDEPSVALANLLAEYGEILLGAGYGERARVSLERSVDILGRLTAEGDVQRARPLLALGRLDAEEDRCDDAEARLRRGLELLETGGSQARQHVSARVALGRCAEAGSLDESASDAAFGHYRAAVLAAREAGLRSPEVATALHRGASLLLARGDVNAAVNFFEEALALRRDLLGEAHWRTAETAYRLAEALDRQGRREAAHALAEETVGRLGRACAPTSQSAPEVRVLCDDLAALRRELVDPTPRQAAAEPQAAAPPPDAAPQTRFRARTQEASTASHPAAGDVAAAGAWRVQVSSQQSPAEAERVAERMRSRFPDLLRAQRLTLERADLPSGIWHRVLFGAFPERDGAVALCERLKEAGLADCLPSRAE